MQQQNKIKFLAKPVTISCNSSHINEIINTDIKFVGHKLGNLSLSLSQEEFSVLIHENRDPMYNTYKITIENIAEQPKAHELLQVAANNAKLGNSKLAVEQAIKALKELVK